MAINSNVKLISSGSAPTTSTLGKGEMAFGKISSDSNRVHLYVSDGTSVTDFNSAIFTNVGTVTTTNTIYCKDASGNLKEISIANLKTVLGI